MVLGSINSVLPQLHCQLLLFGALSGAKGEEGACVSAPGFEINVKCNHSFKKFQRKNPMHVSVWGVRGKAVTAFALAGLHSTEKGIIADHCVLCILNCQEGTR